MRLTKYLRQAFVFAAMQDVPTRDYNAEIGAIILADSLKQLPKTLQEAAQKDKSVLDFVNTRSTHQYSIGWVGVSYYCARGEAYKPSTEAVAKRLKDLQSQGEAAKNARYELEKNLKGVVGGCTTVKQLREALPEFEKYMPSEQEKPSRTVPASANLVTDFTAAGWPKGREKAAEAVAAQLS